MKSAHSKFEIVIPHSDFPPNWTDPVLETVKILPIKLRNVHINGEKIDFNDPESDLKFYLLPNRNGEWPENEIHVRVIVRTDKISV
ncbi:hypothetical protein I5907_11970 [Panacibacter sp. DH6]|uniref:Uncharacterized protein n=1 Tax=Panacibacter microcysteis TaxID=2793269 RepID=A0A931E4L4_9BACT|nr:hypothetical protein [Panacibacter microcysteis]MBG9376953.1 hypothetical protein [Panacibacter microcysteis]